MVKKRNGLVALALAFSLVVASVGTVSAQQSETESPDTPVTTQQERPQSTQNRETREQRVQQVQRTLERCEQIKSRLADRITKSTEVKVAHTERYERLSNRIEAVIASAESRGYDTADLVAAKAAVDAAITAYGVAIDAYTEELGTASEVVCNADANAYGQAIVTSRESLEAVRAAGSAVKTAFRESVVPELEAYKTWLETNESTETSEETAQ